MWMEYCKALLFIIFSDLLNDFKVRRLLSMSILNIFVCRENCLTKIRLCFTKNGESGLQGSTITIKSLYAIPYVCQNFGVRGLRGKIPKSFYHISHLLPGDFPNNFS